MTQQSSPGQGVVKLGSIASFNTGKLNSNAASPNGAYPFFTCSPETLRTDTYSFDTECVLLAGNNANGVFPIKYFEGKFDVYQRTYVIQSLNRSRLENRFLYYALQPKLEFLRRISTGATTKFLTLTILKDLEMDLPSVEVQLKIATILSAYDDLIENNTRRIKILEEMAQAIYREWFVNFRFPGYENVPVVDSPLGPIPEGWEVLPVKNVLDHHIGGGWGKEVEMDQFRVPAFVIRGTDIPAARHASMDNVPFRYHTASNLKSRRLSDGDIVFEVSGGSKGQPVGRALLIKQSLLNDFDADVICASFCKLMRPKTEMIDSYYLYQHLQQIYEDGRIDQYQVQSTGITNFKFSHFLEGELLLLPSVSIRDQFANLSRPISDMILNLGLRNRNLRQTRDLLLPRLISGEMDVSDLDINVGEEVA